mmetsp:Transcript_134717/g.430396  ORF Transcript_134717/g.430396 Transcript_134717/m.430396 type:complete len:344 (-) Transcript_134717:129-1160(-)
MAAVFAKAVRALEEPTVLEARQPRQHTRRSNKAQAATIRSQAQGHEEETTDGGSSVLSDSEGSTASVATATLGPLAPGLQRPVAAAAASSTPPPAPQPQRQPQKPQPGPKARGGAQPKKNPSGAGRVGQPVSSLRASLRSKGNNVMAEVATGGPTMPPASGASREIPSWLSAPTGRSNYLASGAGGRSAQQQSPSAYAAMQANSVPVRAFGADAVAPGTNAPAASSLSPPPGLKPPTQCMPPAPSACERTVPGGAYPRVAPYHAASYEYDYGYEGHMTEYEYYQSFPDHSAAAVLQRLDGYVAPSAMNFDPKLPVKKRVSNFLTEEPLAFGGAWGAEPLTFSF